MVDLKKKVRQIGRERTGVALPGDPPPAQPPPRLPIAKGAERALGISGGGGITEAPKAQTEAKKTPALPKEQLSIKERHDAALDIAIKSGFLTTEAKGVALTPASFFTGGGLGTVKGAVSISKIAKIGKPITFTVTRDAAGRFTKVAANTKSLKQATRILSLSFGATVLGILGAWAGSTFLGLWGQAETPEPITIPISKFLVPNAMQTGDWSLVDEAMAEAEELTNLEEWEKIVLGTPAAPAVGVINKIKGSIAGIEVLKKVIADLRTQESGENRQARLRQERLDDEKANVDYFNEQRKIMFKYEQEALAHTRRHIREDEKQAMREDAAFWAKERKKQDAEEAKERVAIAKFWSEYRKMSYQIEQDNRPSALGFGIL